MSQVIKLQSASRNISRMPKGRETTALFSHAPVSANGSLFVVAEGVKAISTRPDLTSRIPARIIPDDLKDLRGDTAKNISSEYICNRIRLAFERANQSICSEKLSRPNEMRDFSGSSASCVFIWGSTMFIGQIGISRVYLLHNHLLRRLTRDHSVYAELEFNNELTEDDKLREYTWAQHLTRALGHKEDVVADIVMQNLETGDLFLLCTSNIWLLVSEEQLIKCLNTSSDSEAIIKDITKILPDTGLYDFSFVVVKVVGK